MDRLLVLLIALIGIGVLWLTWQGIKLRLRRNIRVDRTTLDGDRPTLLYFSSPDCVPCRTQQAPILIALRGLLGNSVRFQEYDAVAHPEVARRFRVLTVPTTVVIAPGGEVVAVNYGVTRAKVLERQLMEAGARRESLLTSSVA